jgi:uncharacterized protein (TIGR02246 family)
MTVATPEALAAAFSGALNDGDADALGALFTKDALFVNIAGMRIPGRNGIIDGHRWALAGPLKGSTVLVFTLVRTDGGWLAAAATNTPIAACRPPSRTSHKRQATVTGESQSRHPEASNRPDGLPCHPRTPRQPPSCAARRRRAGSRRKRRNTAARTDGTKGPGLLSPSYRHRVRKLSPRNQNRDVKHLPGSHSRTRTVRGTCHLFHGRGPQSSVRVKYPY